MSHHKKSFLSTSLILLGVLAISGGVFVRIAAADEPPLISITPDHGVIGETQIRLTGKNLTDSDNVVDWGFGRTVLSANGNPVDERTLVPDFSLAKDGPGCVGSEGEDLCTDDLPLIGNTLGGFVAIRVTNANGTSNTARFFLMAKVNYCYDSAELAKVACDDPTCDVGNCSEPVPDSTPTPTATPTPTPTATPTPTPSPVASTSDADSSASSSSTASSSSSSSSSATTPIIKGASTSGPSATDKKESDFIANKSVPAVVAALYRRAYGKVITHCSSDYWKTRARSDKATQSKLLGAMQWSKQHNKNPVFRSCLDAQKSGKVLGASTSGKITHKDINRIFRAANNGNNPTGAQNLFWLGRVKDKGTYGAMLGAMQWHNINGTQYGA